MASVKPFVALIRFTALHHLARLTFSQPTIHVIFQPKSSVLLHRRPFPMEIKTIGDLLVATRKAAGLKQKEVSQLAGISRQWLGRWERDCALPGSAEWNRLRSVLNLPERMA
jgi:DNA-binding transcriptional regulator YiaG